MKINMQSGSISRQLYTCEPASLSTPAIPETEDSVNRAGGIPEFGRWQDVQRLFGIKRGTLYNLLGEGKVKSVSMRRKGNKHGCRLFYLPGISQYLNTLMAKQPVGGAYE
jgi:hypothetical protein